MRKDDKRGEGWICELEFGCEELGGMQSTKTTCEKTETDVLNPALTKLLYAKMLIT